MLAQSILQVGVAEKRQSIGQAPLCPRYAGMLKEVHHQERDPSAK